MSGFSDKSTKKMAPKTKSLTNGDLKPKKKQRKYKSKAADALSEIGLSDSDADLSLTTLDLSSLSDSDLTSLQLEKSLRGKRRVSSFNWAAHNWTM